MNSMATSARDQWQRIEGLVQEWLRERQELLYLLCNIRGLRGVDSRDSRLETRVQRFCEVLMDYISAGYFEVYRELAREAHTYHPESAALALTILHRLDDSTDEALAFNEDFDSDRHIRARRAELPHRLSSLLEKLEERFALEDQLIVSIHQSGRAGPRLVH